MTIEGISTNECPVSLITPESLIYLELANRNRHVKEATGQGIFGDNSRCSAKLIDALETLEIERVRVENTRGEAEERSRRQKRG